MSELSEVNIQKQNQVEKPRERKAAEKMISKKQPKGDLSDDEDDGDDGGGSGMVEAGRDNDGNAMFDLTMKKKVFIKEFKGQKMVDIREVYDKNG